MGVNLCTLAQTPSNREMGADTADLLLGKEVELPSDKEMEADDLPIGEEVALPSNNGMETDDGLRADSIVM